MNRLHQLVFSFSGIAFSLLLASGCATVTENTTISPKENTSIEEVLQTKVRAESGDVQAQLSMARIARWHYQDMDEAIEWYSLAAAQGDSSAARSLGDIYRAGLQGVPKDLDEAEKWYRLAVRQGDSFSQHRLDKIIKEKGPVAWAHQEQARIAAEEERQRELDEKKRLKAEARAREKAAEQERLRNARVATIQRRYGQQLGLVVIPLRSAIKVEQPTRKKPKGTNGTSGGGDDALGYLLSGASTGVLLGLFAGALVIDVISNGAEMRLTDDEKKEIKTAAKSLPGILTAQPVEQNLRQHIVESGETQADGSIFTPVAFQPSELDSTRYDDLTGIDTVVELETSGLGLVLSEKQYRPARFLMSNQVKIKQLSNGETIDQSSLCYASSTKNFSDWGAENGKLLKEEMEVAYSRVAEDIQSMLAGELDNASDDEQNLCAALKEKAQQYRRELTPDAR